MRRILQEQLANQLPGHLKMQQQRQQYGCYLLCGPDPQLQQESRQMIRQAANAHGFTEYHHYLIEANTDWQTVDNTCNALSLFANKRILQLTINSSAPDHTQSQRLMALATHLDSTILLILVMPHLKKSQEQSAWFRALSNQALYIACHSPAAHQLPRWIARRATQLGLHLNVDVIAQLCFHYEGHTLALWQLLEQLAVRYPDGQHLTLPQLKSSLHDASCFTQNEWLHALLVGQAQRAIHILQRQQSAAVEPLLLLRTLQGDLLLLLSLKRQATVTPLPTLFDLHAVWQQRRQPLMQALQRLSYSQLRHAVRLLTQLECCLKEQQRPIWEGLTVLSLLLCGAPIIAEWVPG